MKLLKRLVAKFPDRWQSELRRLHYARQISCGRFQENEPEALVLPQLLNEGDWVIDVGANIGTYTKLFSDLVGKTGRVFAFEPVPETFAMLAANCQLFSYKNVTLLNAAASAETGVVSMSIPKSENGLANYYRSTITDSYDSLCRVISLPLDVLGIKQKIACVKIDVEGHEASVIKGMTQLIEKDHPILIVETDSKDVIDMVSSMGFTWTRLDNSPNILFKPS